MRCPASACDHHPRQL